MKGSQQKSGEEKVALGMASLPLLLPFVFPQMDCRTSLVCVPAGEGGEGGLDV